MLNSSGPVCHVAQEDHAQPNDLDTLLGFFVLGMLGAAGSALASPAATRVMHCLTTGAACERAVSACLYFSSA
jgi:hypothetical protein